MSINSIDHEEMSNIAHKWELPEEEAVVRPEKTVGFIGLIEKDLINHNRTPDVAV